MIRNNWLPSKTLYTKYTQEVTGAELLDATLEVTGDTRWDGLKYVIGDWTQVDKTEISAKHVEEMIACLLPASRYCPHAINCAIVKRNNTGTALAAWYKLLGEKLPWQIDIYHSKEEAFEAYGIKS